MTRTVNLKELRPMLPRVIDAVDKKLDRYIVTKRGHPAAVILSVDDYEGMLETMEILRDRPLVRRLRKAEREVKSGKTRALKDIHKALGLH